MKRNVHLVVALALSARFRICRRSPITPLLRDISPCTTPFSWRLSTTTIVRIAAYTVEEKQHAKEVAKSSYFPSIRNDSSFAHVTDTQLIEINAGGLGVAGGNAYSSCEQHHQPGRTQPHDQRDPAHTAVDHAAEDQVGKRYGAGRVESISPEGAGHTQNDVALAGSSALLHRS